MQFSKPIKNKTVLDSINTRTSIAKLNEAIDQSIGRINAKHAMIVMQASVTSKCIVRNQYRVISVSKWFMRYRLDVKRIFLTGISTKAGQGGKIQYQKLFIFKMLHHSVSYCEAYLQGFLQIVLVYRNRHFSKNISISGPPPSSVTHTFRFSVYFSHPADSRGPHVFIIVGMFRKNCNSYLKKCIKFHLVLSIICS